ARAKGLPERTVVMRHAFRNALIPIATIIPFDIGGLIGGAIITERIFGWNGMGRMFLDNLERVDLNPVMAAFLVTGLVAIVFSLVGDLTCAALDPRIRVKSMAENLQDPRLTTASSDIANLEIAGLSQGQIVWKRFKQHKMAVF